MTAQTPDSITVDGREGVLLGEPLANLLNSLEGVPKLVARDTACWRGYVARWRVTDDVLYLDDVTGWVADYREVGASEVLPGVTLPVKATWVSWSLRVGFGDQIRHVHAGYESTYEDEVLLEVAAGEITGRQSLAAPAPMGMAGPYRLEGPLLANLSGGGFGQVMEARDLDGRTLVAKAPRPTGGGYGTEMWNGEVPVHVPARAERAADVFDDWRPTTVGMDVTSAVLRAEAEILERDGGVLLPRSYGIWDHDSGVPVLVMERLEGHAPRSVAEVRSTLAAVADAVARGTFDHHGDLKLEHVFVGDDGTIRICDPGPRFDDPGLRAFTRPYHRGWAGGPAADVAAVAQMLTFLPGGPGPAAGWGRLVDASAPDVPDWVHDHRAALAALDEAIGSALAPPPPSARGELRTPSTAELREQWPSAPPWPADAPPPPMPPPPPGPFDLGRVDPDGVIVPAWFPTTPPSVTATDATVDRLLIAAADHLLSNGTVDRPSAHLSDELVVADAQAVQDLVDALTTESLLGERLFGASVTKRVVERLYWWSSGAIARIDRSARMPRSPLPGMARLDQVERAWNEMWHVVQEELAPATSYGDDVDPWDRLLSIGFTSVDLVWTAASLVTCLIHQRGEAPDEFRGTTAAVLDDVGRSLPGGLLAWKHPAGAKVARPERHGLSAFFDGGSGVLLWIGLDVGEPRWGNEVDHRDLPIPLALADQLDVLLERYDETIPVHGPERPATHAEAALFRTAYREVIDQLRATLGSAYTIGDRSRLR
jgi:hypothetical protein